MIHGIHTHFNEPIAYANDSAGECRQLAQRGFGLARVDVQLMTDSGGIADLVADVRQAGMVALVIVRDAAQLQAALDVTGHDPAVWWELRNEPDIEGPNPTAYAALMRECADVSDGANARLFVGCVSNPHERGRKYLQAIRPTLDTLPPSVGVTWHRYPHWKTGTTFEAPHEGFRSRDDEVAYIRRLTGGRAWGISEFGYSTAERVSPWWQFWRRRRERWTDIDVAELTRREFEFWRRHGAAFSVLYQISDAPGDERLNRYGIRRVDGTWKPVADVISQVV
jgi:hypothetical protein